jgi:4-hydroxy-tetrahydrodipicolinate reductase
MTMNTKKIKVAVCGACGRMGQEVVKAVCNEQDMELVAAIDICNTGKDIGEIIFNKPCGVVIEASIKDALNKSQADVVVDFTSPDIIFQNAKTAIHSGVRPVVGTTGLSDDQLAELKKLSEEKGVATLIAPNFTTGAVLMMMFAKTASKYFKNAEIIELHHNKKKDAPSGTAIKTAQMMAECQTDFEDGNVPEVELINGARGGVSESNIHIHSVRMPGFMAHQEVIFGSPGQILTIRHDSVDRSCYMPGVMMAIRHVTLKNEFVYGLDNIL